MIKHGSRTVDTIWFHCAATRPDWMIGQPLAKKVAEIDKWHKQRGWKSIGYHWLIDRDGTVAPGRPENEVGAHVAGHNTGSIGICLIGGHGSNENDAFEKNYTPAQDAALRALIDDIKSRTPIKRIRGHNDVAAKACPGFRVARWLAHKPPAPSLPESTTMQASAVQVAAGAGTAATAISALDGTAQIVAVVLGVVIIAAAAWVMRERIKRWAKEGGG
jgi:N-acetyl-anhydromuramyl-L-alanine amidase AmpD